MAAAEGNQDARGKPKVILANINRGSLLTEFVRGALDSLTHNSISYIALGESGPYLDRGRNRIVAHCRTLRDQGDVEWDWLLFVDSDIEFTAADVDTLMAPTLHPNYVAPAFPVLSGVYHNPFDDGETPEDPVGPVVYEWVERRFPEMPEEDPAVYAFQRLSRSALATLPPVNYFWNPDGDVCEVAAVGCGFLAIHHTILAALADRHPLPLPYFDEPVINTVHLGEDLAFCYRVRDLGYPVLVNRACRVLHHKTMKLA